MIRTAGTFLSRDRSIPGQRTHAPSDRVAVAGQDRTRIAFVSTYPPTQCGLATFTHSQVQELLRNPALDVGVVSVVDPPTPPVPRPVVHQWVQSARGSVCAAAKVLNTYDAVVLQHEYGIFGGRDGAEVLDLLAQVRVPVVTILHTVQETPSPHQHRVLDGVIRRSCSVVTMTATARRRLLAGWPSADPADVHVVPHGAHPNQAHPGDPLPEPSPVILTWGLLGPGKGIEWAIDALAGVRDLPAPPRYRIVGQTHPRVRARDGEAYRRSLLDRAAAAGVSHLVEFDDRYHNGAQLRRIVRASDVVLLPYDSREQVTSGVLTEAVVAGKPVIATSFPHARELLAGGVGLLVPQRDPAAITAALRRVLGEPGVAESMAARARSVAPSLHWSAVAGRIVDLVRSQSRSAAESVA
jgi:glycosyltransferase involved in cell wall biosynthesis